MPNQPVPSSKWKLALSVGRICNRYAVKIGYWPQKRFWEKLKNQNIRLLVIMTFWENIHFEIIIANLRLRQCNDFIVETISKFWDNCLLTSSENCGVIHEKEGEKSLQRREWNMQRPLHWKESHRAPGIPVPKMCGERNAWGSFLTRDSREAEHDPK
jgi:hypothetical protein